MAREYAGIRTRHAIGTYNRGPSQNPIAMYCAIDFGTSNSAIAIPAGAAGMDLVELEPGHRTMPTAVFYFVDGPQTNGPPRAFGRAAVAAYVDGIDGRLMTR